MAGLNFDEQFVKVRERIGDASMEHMSGKGLLQPFSNLNSGSRKIMHAIHRDHVFPLMNGEKAVLETGYEIRFGDRSSSITSTDSDYVVVAKISKYSFSPNHHYYLILKDVKSNKLDVVERISYCHITESYGYLYNNEYMDTLQLGDFVPENTILQKSMAFDEYNNRKDGVNLNVAYMALDDNMEDSVIFSNEAAEKMRSPLIKRVQIMMNENDIPLNLYGNDRVYKIIPDIGEEIQGALMIAQRKEKKDESLYNQSVQRLKKELMSDEKRYLTGRVIDVNIYCNNPANLGGQYVGQLKMYYTELQRMCTEIVTTVTPFVAQGFTLSYDLQKLFANAKRVNNQNQYLEKKVFSNIILEVIVLEDLPLKVGDKVSNRYGGKGVISNILPKEQMPRFGDNEYVDVILNSSTMYNRENPGQLFELSLTHIGMEIVRYISSGRVSLEEAIEMIRKYLEIVSPMQANYFMEYLKDLSMDERLFFLESIISSKAIDISIKPLSESIDIYKLAKIYDEFPWIEQSTVYVPMVGSNGEIRHIPARRKMVVGLQYMFRLKQFAEEKFSATSLSATNIRNENTKSKASKNFKELYSNTPIRFGNMEANSSNHLGSEHVIVYLLIHSLSPQARRLVEQMYTGEPYEVDIKLDSDSRNRGAEIVFTYLKTIGKRIYFKKIRKNVKKGIVFSGIKFTKCPGIEAKKGIYFSPKKNYNFEEAYQEAQEFEERKMKEKKEVKNGLVFDGKKDWSKRDE